MRTFIHLLIWGPMVIALLAASPRTSRANPVNQITGSAPVDAAEDSSGIAISGVLLIAFAFRMAAKRED